MALAVLGTAVAFAASKPNVFRSGNYYYMEYYGSGSTVGRWYIAPNATNLIVNGNFTQGENLMAGWESLETSEDDPLGNAALGNYFLVVEGAGPNGANALEVIATGGENTGGDIMQAAELEAGHYVITYKVKAAEGVTRKMCEPSSFGTNLQRIFLNEDGTGVMSVDKMDTELGVRLSGNSGVPVSKFLGYDENWKEIAYQVTVTETCYGVFRFANLQVGDQFADFGIYKVSPVWDDRPVTELTNKLKTYLADEKNFPKNRADAQGALEGIEETLAELTNESTQAEIDGVYDEAVVIFNAFMNANTVDVSDYFVNFDLGPELGSNQSKTTVNGWTLNGDQSRWNRKVPAANIGIPTTHINQEAGATAIVLNPDSYFQTQPLIPGTYMYTVKCMAHYNWKGTEWGNNDGGSYNTNYADSIQGMSFYINNDTTIFEHVSTSYAKEYSMVSEVKDSTLTIGFKSAGASKANGGDFRFDNVEIRLLGGWTRAEVDYAYWGVKVGIQREELKNRIATAKEMLESDMYIYGKEVLKDSINSAETAYATEDQYTKEYHQYLLDHVNWIKLAWNAYAKENLEYTTLKTSVNEGNEKLADETRPKSKPMLKQVVDESAAVLAAVTIPKTEADSLKMVEQNVKLQEAIGTFMLDNASMATPYEIAIQDPEMATGTGWTRTRTSNTGFGATGYGYSRGNGANDAQSVYQDIDLPRAGLYILKAYMSANNNGKRDSEETGVFLFLGAKDSVQVHTKPIQEDWNYGNKDWFSVRTIVENVDEVNPIRFGLNAEQNKCCNMISMTHVSLNFLGSYEEYKADSIAAAMKPTKDSLQMVINAMTEMKNEARNPNNVNITPFGQAIETAQGVVDNSNDIDEVNAQFGALEAARQQFVLSGVYPAEGKFYDLSFVIKNPTFEYVETTTGDGEEAVTKRTINDWTEVMAEGQTFNMNGAMLYGKNYTGVEEEDASGNLVARTKLNQTLSGLPAGAFEFGFNATFHGDSKNNIYQVTSKEELYVTTPQDTASCKPIVQEQFAIEGANQAYGTDQNSTYLVYNEDLKLLLYDYRHGTDAIPTLKEAFNQGYYLNLAKLDVAAGETPEVGFYLQDMLAGDYNFFLMNPQLRYYGDDANRQAIIDEREATQSIDALEINNVRYNGTIYNLAGQKLNGKLQKGLYIMNGKKFVVK